VLADIARQISFDRKANPAWKWSATDEDGNLLHHGHTRRRPTATEAAFVRARDRTCRSPGCRRNARRCDLDHRHDYAKAAARTAATSRPAAPTTTGSKPDPATNSPASTATSPAGPPPTDAATTSQWTRTS
jgi:hypothetical protein